MVEIKVVSYEQCRRDFMLNEMQKAQNRIDFWKRKLEKAKSGTAQLECHKNASDAGWEYNYYKDALEALENQPKWISVEERLPEDGVDVLVWRDGCFAIAHIIMADDWTYTGIGGDPTHWMPLPEPPKEG